MTLRCRQDNEGLAILQGFYGSTGDIVPECPPSPDQAALLGHDIEAAVTPSSGHNHNAVRDESDNSDDQDDNNSFGSKGYSTSKSSSRGVLTNTCSSSYATEKILSRCLGFKNCSLVVSERDLGKPDGCPRQTQLHLKVTYVCLPRDVLKSRSLDALTTPSSTTRGSKGDEDYTGFLGSPRFIPDSETTGATINSFPRIATSSPPSVNPSSNNFFGGNPSVSESPITQLAKEMKRYREDGRDSNSRSLNRQPIEGSKSSDSDFLFGQQANNEYHTSHRIAVNTSTSLLSPSKDESLFLWIKGSINTLNFFRGKSLSSWSCLERQLIKTNYVFRKREECLSVEKEILRQQHNCLLT